jgi:predicted DNA-binding transcriptional regulator YafY
VPVYAERGPGGGFRLLDGYRTRLTGLAADEAQALFMIGLPGPASALGLGPAAKRARHKLLAALPAGQGDHAHQAAARFHLDPVDWYRAPEPAGHLPALARALFDQRRVALRYASWTRTRRFGVEPLGLVLKAGSWYLVARRGRATRIFKVASILELTTQATSFTRPEGFDLAVFWQAALRRFEAQLRPARARLWASAVGLRRLSLLGAYAAQAVREAGAPEADGRTRVVLPIETVEQAALALLGLGPEIEVDQPAELRAALRDLAAQIARRHGARGA